MKYLGEEDNDRSSFECSKGHEFIVDPADGTNTVEVHVYGKKVQVEKCPACGELGDTTRYKEGSNAQASSAVPTTDGV